MSNLKQIAVTGKKGKNFRDITDIMNIPAEAAKLQSYIDEAVTSKQKIMEIQENIKTVRESAVDAVGIEPKMFNTLVSLFYNSNFDEKKNELEKLDNAIDAVLMKQPHLSQLSMKDDDE